VQPLEVNLTIVGADTYNLNTLKTKPKGGEIVKEDLEILTRDTCRISERRRPILYWSDNILNLKIKPAV